MAENELIVGIDAGGTVTTAAACDIEGNIAAVVSGPSINHNSVGIKKAKERLDSIIHRLHSVCGERDFSALFIGSSALYRAAEDNELKSLTENILPAGKIGMNSDLYIAMESLLCEGPCVLAVSGTGSMVIGRDGDGKISQTGGWGYILGDEGSAYHMALAAIKYALRAYDGLEDKSEIQAEVLNFYDAESPRDLINIFYNPVIDREKIASFAQCVYDFALRGDRVCREIILKEAAYMSEASLKEFYRIRKPDAKLGIYGGVFLNNSIFRDEFFRLVHERAPEADISILQFPPHVGALFCALKLLGKDVSPRFISNIRHSL